MGWIFYIDNHHSFLPSPMSGCGSASTWVELSTTTALSCLLCCRRRRKEQSTGHHKLLSYYHHIILYIYMRTSGTSTDNQWKQWNE